MSGHGWPCMELAWSRCPPNPPSESPQCGHVDMWEGGDGLTGDKQTEASKVDKGGKVGADLPGAAPQTQGTGREEASG